MTGERVGLTVQTANQRETELSGLQIIHRSAVDVDLIVLLVESTKLEAYWAKQISHL